MTDEYRDFIPLETRLNIIFYNRIINYFNMEDKKEYSLDEKQKLMEFDMEKLIDMSQEEIDEKLTSSNDTFEI